MQWESCDKKMWWQLLLMMVVDGRSRLRRVVVGVSVRWPGLPLMSGAVSTPHLPCEKWVAAVEVGVVVVRLCPGVIA